MKQISFFLLCISFLHATTWNALEPNADGIILKHWRLDLEDFPGAFNPSIIEDEEGYLLSFRYCPNMWEDPYLNYIGIVRLDEDFQITSKPQLLNTRPGEPKTKSQSEDARLFTYKDKTFLIFNDCVDITNPTVFERRDMFIAELLYKEGIYSVSPPIKLICEEKVYSQYWQKNWLPFTYEDNLLITYSINPHEILFPNLYRGSCYLCYSTPLLKEWNWGILRGSSPPIRVGDEYLAFFHSGKIISSPASWGWDFWHYFMGAYTFSEEPPFNITKISKEPLIAEGFYTESNAEKRVIFPGGFVVLEDKLLLTYAKDDCEIWLALLNTEKLLESLTPVEGN